MTRRDRKLLPMLVWTCAEVLVKWSKSLRGGMRRKAGKEGRNRSDALCFLNDLRAKSGDIERTHTLSSHTLYGTCCTCSPGRARENTMYYNTHTLEYLCAATSLSLVTFNKVPLFTLCCSCNIAHMHIHEFKRKSSFTSQRACSMNLMKYWAEVMFSLHLLKTINGLNNLNV